MADMIDEILKADEEALKAKRARLQTLSKKLDSARQAINEAQTAVAEVTSQDGLTRSDVAKTFELTSQERRVLMPAKKSTAKTDDPAPVEHPAAGQPAAY